MEAMEERQVTSLGVRRPLDRPFFVLATQNPIEQQGTYPLPVAQLDRFMFKVRLGYPAADQEARIVRLTTAGLHPPPPGAILSRADLLGFQTALAHADVPAEVVRYAVDLVRASRPAEATAPATVREHVAWGAGPRAAQALVAASKARALLSGRTAPDAGDVRALAPAVLRHRFVLSYAAEADGVSADDVAQALLDAVPCPGGQPRREGPPWVVRLLQRLLSPSPSR
jgi:MoxR-like ATPase